MTDTATVETLTAEVRVLMVGNRQITLSVARQLDTAGDWDIEPFGRVRLGGEASGQISLIGAHRTTGALVVAHVSRPQQWNGSVWNDDYGMMQQIYESYLDLDLIVLAGLK